MGDILRDVFSMLPLREDGFIPVSYTHLKLMRSRPIKDINQINAALEIMLCREHDENFNLDELSRVYNINGEKLKEIISLLDGSNDINEQTD